VTGCFPHRPLRPLQVPHTQPSSCAASGEQGGAKKNKRKHVKLVRALDPMPIRSQAPAATLSNCRQAGRKLVYSPLAIFSADVPPPITRPTVDDNRSRDDENEDTGHGDVTAFVNLPMAASSACVRCRFRALAAPFASSEPTAKPPARFAPGGPLRAMPAAATFSSWKRAATRNSSLPLFDRHEDGGARAVSSSFSPNATPSRSIRDRHGEMILWELQAGPGPVAPLVAPTWARGALAASTSQLRYALSSVRAETTARVRLWDLEQREKTPLFNASWE